MSRVGAHSATGNDGHWFGAGGGHGAWAFVILFLLSSGWEIIPLRSVAKVGCTRARCEGRPLEREVAPSASLSSRGQRTVPVRPGRLVEFRSTFNSEVTGAFRDVHGMLLERRERDNLQCSLMGRGQHDIRGPRRPRGPAASSLRSHTIGPLG